MKKKKLFNVSDELKTHQIPELFVPMDALRRVRASVPGQHEAQDRGQPCQALPQCHERLQSHRELNYDIPAPENQNFLAKAPLQQQEKPG